MTYPLIGSSCSLDIGWLTDPGCVRSRNEDSVGVFTENPARGYLFVVADGMGGGPAGETASRMATDLVQDAFFHQTAGEAILPSLEQALVFANQKIHERAEADLDCLGMGSTCTAAVVQESRLFWVHSGDTRCYLISPRESRRLTRDHRSRKLAADPTRTQFRSETVNMLESYLGMGPEIQVECSSAPISLRPGDRVFLCSDGLYNLLTDTEMAAILLEQPAEPACASLIQLARKRGGPDNISAILAAVHD